MVLCDNLEALEAQQYSNETGWIRDRTSKKHKSTTSMVFSRQSYPIPVIRRRSAHRRVTLFKYSGTNLYPNAEV